MNKIWLRSIKSKGKMKCTLEQALRLCTGHTAHRGSRGIALLFLDHGTRRGWGVSVTPRPLFTPGKDTLYRRLGGPQGRSRWVRKISTPSGFDPRTVQLVVSAYTDYDTRPTPSKVTFRKSASRVHIAPNAPGSGYNHPVTPRSTDLIQKPTSN